MTDTDPELEQRRIRYIEDVILPHARSLLANGDTGMAILYLCAAAVDIMPEDAIPSGSVEEGEFRFILESLLVSGMDMLKLYNKVVPDSGMPEFDCDTTTH